MTENMTVVEASYNLTLIMESLMVRLLIFCLHSLSINLQSKAKVSSYVR